MGGKSTRGMKKRAGQIMLGLAFSLVFSSCKKAEVNASRVCDREGYIRQSLAFKEDEGEGALKVKSEPTIAEGYFGKRYNQDWLDAVARSSIRETISFIETTGARVYRADSISDDSGKPMGLLPFMTWDLDREWRKADRPLNGEPCGFLAGLYLSANSRFLPALSGKAAVIVREDAGRWTLVHEFMHHNFKTQAIKDGYNDDLLQSRRVGLLKSIDALKKDHSISNREYALQLSSYFQELMDVVDKLVVQYYFEEMSVEAMLQDRFERGELKYVPVGAYTNATWYIEHSKKAAEDVYAEMTATYDEIYRLAVTNGLYGETRKISRFIDSRDDRLAQAESVIARRKNAKSMRMGFVPFWLPREKAAEQDGFVPCAHAEEAAKEIREILEVLRIPRVSN